MSSEIPHYPCAGCSSYDPVGCINCKESNAYEVAIEEIKTAYGEKAANYADIVARSRSEVLRLNEIINKNTELFNKEKNGI